MGQVRCKHKLITKYATFVEGEVYDANKINNKYFLVEAVGIEKDVFNEHFEVILDDKLVEGKAYEPYEARNVFGSNPT